MRTTWNVGLATCAGEPAPLTTPRTKVVLPAPRSPFRSSRSPCRSPRPKVSPAASVSAAELVNTSSKVVVAAEMQLERRSAGAHNLDRGVVGQHAKRAQPRAANHVLRPDANQLGLLPTRERVLPGGAIGQRDIGGPDGAARARGVGELLHLAQQTI